MLTQKNLSEIKVDFFSNRDIFTKENLIAVTMRKKEMDFAFFISDMII